MASKKKSINKKRLAKEVAKVTHTTQYDSLIYIEVIFDVIAEMVTNGERVSISGFGSFFNAPRKGRMVTNPQTGELMKVEDTVLPKFKVGTTFRRKAKKL